MDNHDNIMKESFFVTGVSGSGKTSICQRLNELGYRAYDMDDYPGLFSMIDDKTGKSFVDYDSTDLNKVKNMNWICDKEKLAAIIKNESNKIAFYFGIASNQNEILPFFDSIILLRVSPGVMRKRLNARTNNDYGKNKEVQDWIISWKDRWENDMKEKGAIVIDGNESIDQVVEKVIQIAVV